MQTPSVFYVHLCPSRIKQIATRKDHVIRFLKQSFCEGVDFCCERGGATSTTVGGRPPTEHFLTEEAMNLLVTSFNPRSISHTATLGFIFDMLTDVTTLSPQHMCGPYKIDLYLPDHRICIECDERAHKDRASRQAYIESALGAVFVRFDPSVASLDLPKVVGEVVKLMMAGKRHECV